MVRMDQDISYLQKKLIKWYQLNGRNFPWRSRRLSSYKKVIAEVLLQRTKADTVSKYFNNFLNRFPSWKSLIDSDISEIENFLKPLGLSKQRSVRLYALSKEMNKRNGKFPKIRSELESIPFMGQYLTNAVELFILNKPSPLIDVNMARVLERYFGPRNLSDIRYDSYLQELAHKLVDHKESIILNWAILDFAALVCKPKPICESCLVNMYCRYYKAKQL
jgi:A/G-specific adenine glycosylase